MTNSAMQGAEATATGLNEVITHAAELLLTLSRVTPRRTIDPNVPLGRDILETAERLAALSQTLPAPGEEACPVCEGKPMPLGSGCMAGCRDGIVLTTSANVLRNLLFWFRMQEREIAELRMTPERREAIRQAAREAVGNNTTLHPWHVIDETILAMSSPGSSVSPEKPLATVAAANDEGAAKAIEALETIAAFAEVRIQDGQDMGARIWRIALEDIITDARAAIRLLSQGGGK